MSRLQNAVSVGEDAKQRWRDSRKPGDTQATFRPGEQLRCPGMLRTPGYVGPCGQSWSEYANPHTRVIIRVSAHRGSDDPQTGTHLRCHKCGTALEKLTILEASE